VTRWILLSLLLLGPSGCSDDPVDDDDVVDDDDDTSGDDDEVLIELEATGSRLAYYSGGYIDIFDEAGNPILLHGVGVLVLNEPDDDGIRLSTDGNRDREVSTFDIATAMGQGHRLEVAVAGLEGEPDLVWTIDAYDERGFYTFLLRADNHAGVTVHLAKSAPIQTSWEEDGGLFLGQHPAEHRVLDNGSYSALDFIAQVYTGDHEHDEAYANLIPGDYQGHIAATGNHAVTDLACLGDDAPGSCHWVAGALSFETSAPVINLSHNPLIAPQSTDGRLGFHYFSAESAWLPEPEPLADGVSQQSELYFVHPAPQDALAGLELYAEVTAEAIGTEPWHRREDGRRVPNGWNSWAGSGSTGGYGTDINEEVILENLDIMATELRDWGIDWFQMDDGYEPYYGDWYEWMEERFPNGPAWLSQQIRDRGLTPGLWMAPFTADPLSQIVADHPDYFIDPVALGVPVVGDTEILDLSNPDVHDYLAELFTTFKEEWGFDWLKLDFGYYAMFGAYEAGTTREEAWRSAMEVIREALGEDTFFLIIGQMGVNYGIADGGRVTLDTMPVWDREPGQTMVMEEAGMKPSARTVARRWYVQDRTWITHPDLFFFRSHTNDETWPRVTATEARTFCSFIALTGGIVKLGDRLVDLDGDSINVIRTMIPIYPTAARPLDVFEREFPEVYLQHVAEPLDGFEESYHVLGLFNWGENRDLSVNPFEDIPDTGADIDFTVDLVELGLEGEYLAYEFWTGEFLGTVSGELSATVASHDCQVIALRPPVTRPQFMGWNRQISMGGTVLGAVEWDAGTETLALPMQAAVPTEKAPFTYEVVLHVPEAFEFTAIESDGVVIEELQTTVEGEVLRVTFVPTATGDLTLSIVF